MDLWNAQFEFEKLILNQEKISLMNMRKLVSRAHGEIKINFDFSNNSVSIYRVQEFQYELPKVSKVL